MLANQGTDHSKQASKQWFDVIESRKRAPACHHKDHYT